MSSISSSIVHSTDPGQSDRDASSIMEPSLKKRKGMPNSSLLPDELINKVVLLLGDDDSAVAQFANASRGYLVAVGKACRRQVRQCIPRAALEGIDNIPDHLQCEEWKQQDSALRKMCNLSMKIEEEHVSACKEWMHLIRAYKKVSKNAYRLIICEFAPKILAEKSTHPLKTAELPKDIREASLNALVNIRDPRSVCCDSFIFGSDPSGFTKAFGDAYLLMDLFGDNWKGLLDGVTDQTVLKFHEKVRNQFLVDEEVLYPQNRGTSILPTVKYLAELDRVYMSRVEPQGISEEDKKKRILCKVTEYGSIAFVAISKGDLDVLKWMVKEDLRKPIEATDQNGRNIAHHAAKVGHELVLAWILEELPYGLELLQATDKRGWNIAHHAAKGGHERALTWICDNVDNGVNLIKAADINGFNIAHISVYYLDERILDWIKKKVEDSSSLLNATSREGWNIALIAVGRRSINALNWIKKNVGNSSDLFIRTSPKGWNIAHHAASHFNPSFITWVKMNVENSSDLLNATTLEGWNIAHIAAQAGNIHTLSLIVHEIVASSELLKAKDRNGWNIAHIAAKNRQEKVLTWIQDNLENASELLSARGNKGETIFDIAKARRHRNVLDWIQKNLNP